MVLNIIRFFWSTSTLLVDLQYTKFTSGFFFTTSYPVDVIYMHFNIQTHSSRIQWIYLKNIPLERDEIRTRQKHCLHVDSGAGNLSVVVIFLQAWHHTTLKLMKVPLQHSSFPINPTYSVSVEFSVISSLFHPNPWPSDKWVWRDQELNLTPFFSHSTD